MKRKTGFAMLMCSLLTAALLFCFASGAGASEVIAQGTCGKNGDNLTWTLTDDGVLTVSGIGNMQGYYVSNGKTNAPWSAYDDIIKTVVIEEGVTGIGAYAFLDGLAEEVSLPDSLLSIGASAFENCRSLKSITLPEKVNTIDYSAFENCTGLSELNINCRNLTDAGTSIGTNAFENIGANCAEVTVTFGDQVKSIPDGMFYRTYNHGSTPVYPKITAVHIGKSVASIGKSAFEECKKLKTVTADADAALRTIGNQAFQNCTALQTAVLPKNVETVGLYAFYGCTSLNRLTVYATNITDTDDTVFQNAGTSAKTFEVVFTDSVLHIPQQMFGCRSYSRNCGVTSVTLGKNIEDIGSEAFCACTRLAAVHLPEESALESIGAYAFMNCASLTSLTLPAALKEIDTKAFSGCTYLENIAVASERLQLANNADDVFSDAGKAADALEVVFEDGAELVPARMFKNGYVTKVTFGSGIESIGNSAFAGCELLQTAVIPQDCALKTIGNYAFNGCKSLTSVTLPQHLTTLGEYAFNNCIRLRELEYYCEKINLETFNAFANAGSPAGFKASFLAPAASVPKDLFATYNNSNKKTDSNSLTEVYIDASVKKIGENAFSYCKKLGKLEFSEESKLETIGKCAFEYCTSLKEIRLPGTVTSIGEKAFINCAGLQTVTIPDENALESIETAAFEGCEALKEIRITNPNCAMNSQFGKDTVIEGYLNSTAHLFANEYGYTFRPIAGGRGDVDGDGQITAADARLALRAAVGLENYEPGNGVFKAADVDNDNTITASDARLILRAAVGLETL